MNIPNLDLSRRPIYKYVHNLDDHSVRENDSEIVLIKFDYL